MHVKIYCSSQFSVKFFKMKIICLLFCGLVILGAVGSDVPKKLLLTVYYESKCPDSKKFIIEQLIPAVQRLQEYLKLQLVPFGKARSIPNSGGGFQCQHGPLECRGNLLQDCALNIIKDRSDVEKVVYVGCEMSTVFGTQGILQCAQNSNIPLPRLRQCIKSDEGVSLQLESEYLTGLVKPKWVPTITIDGVFDQQIQDRAQNDLMGTLCSILKDAPQCDYHQNKMALHYLLY